MNAAMLIENENARACILGVCFVCVSVTDIPIFMVVWKLCIYSFFTPSIYLRAYSTDTRLRVGLGDDNVLSSIKHKNACFRCVCL